MANSTRKLVSSLDVKPRSIGAHGMSAKYKEQESLAHWYSGDMLADVVTVLESMMLLLKSI